jgi:methionine-rich copper-binding protein CopC
MSRGYAEVMTLKIGASSLALAMAALVTFTPSVRAHTELIATSPASNSVVATQPKNITLTFSEAPILAGSRVEIEQPAGTQLASKPIRLVGPDLVVAWPVGLRPGLVSVHWRAVADDGHVTNGNFSFSYRDSLISSSSSPKASAGGGSGNIAKSAGVLLLILLVAIVATTRRKR